MTGFAEVLTFHQVTCLRQINQLHTSQLLNGNKFEEYSLKKKKSIKTLYENLNPKIPDALIPLEKGVLSTNQIPPFTTQTLQ